MKQGQGETALEVAKRLHGSNSEIVKLLEGKVETKGETVLEYSRRVHGPSSEITKALEAAAQKQGTKTSDKPTLKM